MNATAKDAIKWLIGYRRGHYRVVDTDRLARNWSFRPSRPNIMTVLRRRKLVKNAIAAPPMRCIKPPTPHGRWSLYFVYAPDGTLTDAHRFTLALLRDDRTKVMVVLASRSPDLVPDTLHDADALYWKALPGFDFSGYAIGLRALAKHSPGADILVMNDSVFGPFADLDTMWAGADWQLTGFTASSNIENHIQSYAFMLRNWLPQNVAALSDIFGSERCFDSYEDVVFCQESRFARVASSSMSVGALWYGDYTACADPSIFAASSLIDEGFPFLKKSLLTKHADKNDVTAIRRGLARHGHPM